MNDVVKFLGWTPKDGEMIGALILFIVIFGFIRFVMWASKHD